MNEKVLFVDDDINLLSAIKRFLRNDLKFETTLSGQKGLEIIADEGPFAVVVADMRMPGMDGVEFLRRVKNDNPDTVRIMLTGNADMQTAIKAVNEGNIFRFLTKPTSKETLIKAINAGIFQYKLQIAERELLEKTLHGSINTLTEILSVVNPVAFAKTQRIKKFIHHMAEHLEFDNIWQFEIAAMLSQIGCVTIPTEILEKELAGEKLTDIEKNMLESHPITAAKLLSNIPRIETIAEIIKNQNTPPELTSPPPPLIEKNGDQTSCMQPLNLTSY